MLNDKLDLPFDLYTRNKIISDLIGKLRNNNQPLRILDVGGRSGDLKKFLQEDDDHYILDIRNSEYNENNYFLGNIINAPFKDLTFDVVVSSELYEHIAPEDRERSVSEMLRISKNFIILGAPFFSEEVKEAEIKVNEFFHKLTGNDHQWLAEHIKNGLPSEKQLKDFLKINAFDYAAIETNNISNWVLMQLFIFYSYKYGISEKDVFNVYRFYNENFSELGDTFGPTYRKIYLIWKKRTLKKVDLKSNNVMNVSKYRILETLIFETIAQSTDNLQKQNSELIKNKDNEIQNLNAKIADIHRSIIWQLLSKYQRFVDRIFPSETKIRRVYDLGIISVRIIINEGVRSFWIRFKYNIGLRIHKRSSNKEIEISDLKKIIKYKLSDFLSKANSKLVFPIFEEPIVSIIILTFNKAEFTYQCFESILSHTKIPFEIIIVDNGSTDETISLLDRTKNVTIIKNTENLGFIKGCNQGASKAKGKYLLFLNNDTVVTPEWLSNIVNTIENYANCGAVGCKLVWPNGKLQEAGSIIWNDGSALGYGRGDNPMKPEYSYLREVDYCSGACLLVRKDLFQKLDGFDERYIPAYYEDSDLCLGIWKLGFNVVFQPKTVIFHHEFTSSSFEKAVSRMEVNRLKFINKWNDLLINKLSYSNNNVISVRDLRHGTKILVIDDRIPTPDQGAGYPRAYQMLKFLGESGYKITFYPFYNTIPWEPTTSEMQQLGIEIFYGDDFDFGKFAQNRMKFYDIVLVSRPHNMVKSFNTIKKFFSNASLIYDAEALFSIREILKAKVKGKELNEKNIKRLVNEEMNLIKKADLVVTVSEKEKEMILEKGTFNNVFVWGHPIDIKNIKKSFHERRDILFVGGFLAGHDSPNEDAILYFVKEVFPKIQKELSCNLYIVGINPTEQVKKLSSSSIIVTGYVETIEEYYDKCRVFIVPHRYAAGIPWKLQEAMSYGIPSVVSELIASQLNLKDNLEVLIAKNSDEFSEKVINLYQNEELWFKIQNNSIGCIKKTCNPHKMREELNEIIQRSINS